MKYRQPTKGRLIIGIIFLTILLLVIIASCADSIATRSSGSGSLEKRCWYCGKVIVNSEGREIHMTNGKCDYCGHKN